VGQQRRVSFRDRADRAENLTRALAVAVRQESERIKAERRNDTAELIDFLNFVAATLDQIADAISQARAATNPQEKERKFGEAESLAGSMARAVREFCERNRDRVIDYGGYSLFTILGTLFFAGLFNVSYDEALLAQLALLGLTPGKK